MSQIRQTMGRFALLAVSFVAILGAGSGCKNKNQVIQKATFAISENLETVRVSLLFTPRVTLDLAGEFTLKDYGSLFINPFTAQQPFEIGFHLNTAIINDQDYVQLTPTTVLPNGLPIGLPYALAEIRRPEPISDKFDIYGYVDVLHTAWIGTSAIFNFMDNKNLPANMSMQQVFLRDNQGSPGVMASVFGPTVDANGNLVRHGGIALFANVRQLKEQFAGGTSIEQRGEIISLERLK